MSLVSLEDINKTNSFLLDLREKDEYFRNPMCFSSLYNLQPFPEFKIKLKSLVRNFVSPDKMCMGVNYHNFGKKTPRTSHQKQKKH